MSTAFLALWNDYPASLTGEYEAWHTYEHVPERLTAPGMVSARRYAAFDQPHNRYFTLYALEDLKALEHPAYMDLVRQPTDWSLSMRRHFLNVLRIPALDFVRGGNGIGGGMIVQAYSVERQAAERAAEALAEVLDGMIADGRILGFRIGLAEPNQPYEVFDQTDVTDPDTVNVVVLVEGTSRSMLKNAREAIDTAAASLLKPRRCLRNDLFELLVNYLGEEFPRDRHAITTGRVLRGRFQEDCAATDSVASETAVEASKI